MKRVVLMAAALVAALGVMASSATSAPAVDGITARTITIGGTHPLTGPASPYATISTAMKAYFSYINARKGPDGKRGVYGRQIVYNVYDDAYNPANTVAQVRRLVEQDKVFAVVGGLGTEHGEAVRPYLNARKVPQILNATGATTWSRDVKKYPWTGGWLPDYEWEGRLYGQAIARNSPNAKIAVLLQNDSFGEDNLRGLKLGLGARASNIVAEERFQVTAPDIRTQIAKLRASGASVFVIVATPRLMVQAYVFANALGWRPPVIYTTLVSATDVLLTTAKAAGGGDLVDNTYTAQYAKDPANPSWDDDAGMKLYKSVMARYYPKGNVAEALNLYGVAAAHAFVQLMYTAGKNPTRESLMRAYRNWNQPSPFLLPGNPQKTGGNDQRPVDCLRLAKFTGGELKFVSKLRCASHKTAP
jgi:branched-chain amino acid transport system substrate-binding protein